MIYLNALIIKSQPGSKFCPIWQILLLGKHTHKIYAILSTTELAELCEQMSLVAATTVTLNWFAVAVVPKMPSSEVVLNSILDMRQANRDIFVKLNHLILVERNTR